MVFSSIIFLFCFLPIVLAIYFALGARVKNLWLLLASLVFYAWGEKEMVWLVLFASLANYGFGMALERSRKAGDDPKRDKRIVVAAVIANLGLLSFFKYSGFIVENLNFVMSRIHLDPILWSPIALPIGISFFTFHALSYVIDVYRRETPAQRNPLDLALYITFFPQLIAGPIVRYHDIVGQLPSHPMRFNLFVSGVKRLIFGLSKKTLIANNMALVADQVFAVPASGLHPSLAWLGIAAYTLQIYFDFSGYSDMAIGLARMFGFEFKENFLHPYISQSITEFWRRWHVSLSTWFRDYVYIPLGGNRVSRPRLYFNLILVFLLTGLWHGASWTFIVWGLYHGSFLILERIGGQRALERAWRPLRHAYVLLAVMIGWVFFRSESFGYAAAFLQAMGGLRIGDALQYPLAAYLNEENGLILILGCVFATPVYDRMKAACGGFRATENEERNRILIRGTWRLAGFAAYAGLMFLSVMELAASSYNPFIYFRF